MSTNSDNLFNEPGKVDPPAQEGNPPVDKYADLLKSIVNEDGKQKYDSLEKALEALAHAQRHIPELKAQLSEKEKRAMELEEMLGKTSSIEDLVTRLTEKKEPDSQGNPPVANGLDEQAVAKILEDRLAQREIAARAEANKSKVAQALNAKYGDKAPDEIKRIASEVGMTPQELGELATRSPDAVLRFFNAAPVKGATPTTGSLNIPPINHGTSEIKRPERSVLSGPGAGKDAVELMRQIKENTLEKAKNGYYQ